MSLAKKNLLNYTIAILAVFAVFVLIVYFQSKSTLMNAAKERASTSITTFEAALNGSGLQGSDENFAGTMQSELDVLSKNNHELKEFTLYDVDKKTAIASTNPESRNKSADPEDLVAARNNQTVELIDKEDGETVVDVTAPIHINGSIPYVAGVMFSIQNDQQQIYMLLMSMILTGLACSAIAVFLIWFFVIRKSTLQLKNLMLVSEKLAKGELTAKANVESKDEIGKLAQNINAMTDSLSGIIRNVTGNARQIASNSGNLATMTEQTAATIEDVAKTVDGLAKGAMDQTSAAETGLEKLLLLANQINSTIEGTTSINHSISQTETINENAKETLRKLVQELHTNNEVSKQIAVSANSLLEKSTSIGQVVESIRSVAEQTNLLSLNAAIEAARAGEQGKGFAVVADEIRKLAEQTSESTKNITVMISEIQNDIQVTKTNIDQGVESLDMVNDKLNDTTQAFDKIDDAVKTSMNVVGELLSNIDQIDKNKNEVVELIRSISSISENTASATQEVSASIEEETAAVENISNSAGDLNGIASELNSLIAGFRL